MKRLPPHITGGAAFALVGAGICLVHFATNVQREEPTECPPLTDIDTTVIRCASGNPTACDDFASMTDQCVLQWFESRLMVDPVAAEGEDITV